MPRELIGWPSSYKSPSQPVAQQRRPPRGGAKEDSTLGTLGAPEPSSGASKGRRPRTRRHASQSAQLFAGLLGKVAGGGSFYELLPRVAAAAADSNSLVGRVLKEGGRVPFPLPEGGSAKPEDWTGVYPSDELFPLPLPCRPLVPPRGRGRGRAQKREIHNLLLELAVCHVNVQFAGQNAVRAIPRPGVPASAKQYRCLGQLNDGIRFFLREIEEARGQRPPGGPCPTSFLCGADSLQAFLRASALDSEGADLGSVGLPRAMTAETVGFLPECGLLDPVDTLQKGGFPVVASIFSNPDLWRKTPVPPSDEFPRAPFWVEGFEKLIEKEVRCGFSVLMLESQIWQHPDGSFVDNGLFEIGKTPEIGRPIQADNSGNYGFVSFPKAPIDSPERLVSLYVAKAQAPLRITKRDAENFYTQYGIQAALSRYLYRKGSWVTPELARLGAPLGPGEDVSTPRPGWPTPEEPWRGGKVRRRSAPRVVPMGFGGAVVAASYIQDCYTNEAGMPKAARLHPSQPAPLGLPCWGSIIDDVWGIAGGDRETVRKWFVGYDEVCARKGVRMSRKKDVNESLGGEIQGVLFKSDRDRDSWEGVAPIKRTKLWMAGIALLGTQRPSAKAVARFVGKYQHMALPLRHPFAGLEYLFMTEEDRADGQIVWDDQRWEEMLGLVCSLPLLQAKLSSEFDPILTASDASGGAAGGLGVSEALLSSPEEAHRLSAHASFRGDYSTLDSIIPGVAAWNPDSPLRLQALEINTEVLAWRHVLSLGRKERHHINVAETHAYVLALFRKVQDPSRIGTRGIYLIDSGAATGALAKGRSSAWLINRECQMASALCFAGGCRSFFCWVPSKKNPADLPSRLFSAAGPVNRPGPQKPAPVLTVRPIPTVVSPGPQQTTPLRGSPQSQPSDASSRHRVSFERTVEVFPFLPSQPASGSGVTRGGGDSVSVNSGKPVVFSSSSAEPRPGASAELPLDQCSRETSLGGQEDKGPLPENESRPLRSDPFRRRVLVVRDELGKGAGEQFCLSGWEVEEAVCEEKAEGPVLSGGTFARVSSLVKQRKFDMMLVVLGGGVRSRAHSECGVSRANPWGESCANPRIRLLVQRQNQLLRAIMLWGQWGARVGTETVWVSPKGATFHWLPQIRHSLSTGALKETLVDMCTLGSREKGTVRIIGGRFFQTRLFPISFRCPGGHDHDTPGSNLGVPPRFWVMIESTAHTGMARRGWTTPCASPPFSKPPRRAPPLDLVL